MADRQILYRLRAALQGGKVAVANEVELIGAYAGLLNGVSDIGTGFSRIDGTGIGSAIFTFSGNYSAQSSNISEWFGSRQQTRLRCISNAGFVPVTFTLPGTSDLNTAFDTLVTNGLPGVIRFVIEYTGGSSTFLRIVPRAAPSPQIGGATSIVVRSGIAATVEVTRTSGTISDYVFQSIGGISDVSGSTLEAIKLINPTRDNWDASPTGVLPTQVVKGNAYKVVNAPADGSGRFGEVMQNGDWVVWEGETFTSWSATPHQWFVLPAHEVRRISALEQDFLTDIQITPQGTRNSVTRGADYADNAGEIRLKIYMPPETYDAADLNINGDIDEYVNASNIHGKLAIRLAGTQSSLSAVLPTLYVYSEDSNGNFTRLGNLATDFVHQGDFGTESDYLSVEDVLYTAGDTIRIYLGSVIDRYNNPNLDIFEINLSDALQSKVNQREAWASIAEVLFSGATVRDIHLADRIAYDTGYSRGIDWRDMANSTTINANRYIDDALTISANNAAFTINGFGVLDKRLCLVQLQRNDAQTGDGALVELGLGTPFVRVNTSNEIQVNTTPGSGSENWESFNAGSLTNPTIGTGINYLVFELLPLSAANSFEVVAALYDGTTYTQLNNIDFTISGSVTGDDMGFSRSSIQRGQLLRFSAINSPGYLRHSQLQALLQQHVNDKWNFGFARLIEGSDVKEVVFSTELGLPLGSMIGNGLIPKAESVVYEATGTGTTSGELVSSVALPENYLDFKYIHVTEYDVSSLQWRHSEFPTSILAHVDANDNIRLQGNTVMSWASGTRTLAMNPSAQEIFRVSLKD